MTAGRTFEVRGRILGNLDFETELAAATGPRRALSRPALETASALATLLRAFARNGDVLWTPAPVAPERLAEIPGLPRPELESGPLGSLPGAREILAWGETPAVAAHRLRRPDAGPPGMSRGTESEGDPLHELLWRLPAADPAAVADLHHRAFALEVADRLGGRLPGARMVVTPAELADHLRRAGRRPWVVKAPFSAAGRDRVVASGTATATEARRIRRLFARCGPLLFEPWLERTEDFGVVGVLGASGSRRVGCHRSFTSPRGAFLGLELGACPSAGSEGLDAAERARLEEVFEEIARALRERGYTGPFGVDAWRYRSTSGNLAFHPLGEINVRMTFGLVARALVDRIRGPLGLAPRTAARLRVGRQLPDAGPEIVPLLLPDTDNGAAAWLEIPGR